MAGKKYKTVDEYMQDFSGETRTRIETLRQIILKIVPNVTERISYNIPAYFIGKSMVVYFAGYAGHVSLYPLHLLQEKDASQFSTYASGKATLKLSNTQPLPIDLIEKFVHLRTKEVLASMQQS